MSYLTTRLLPRVSSLSSSKSRKSNDSLNSPSSPTTPSPLKLAGPAGHPHTDSLPNSPALLEGQLNHLASQLQTAAKRVEAINEFIDMEAIVLARLIRDEKQKIEKKNEEDRANGVVKRDSGKWGDDVGDMGSLDAKENAEAETTNEILTKKELLGALRRCKRGMEKSVVWQRDEFRRVEKALGRPREKSSSLENGGLGLLKPSRESGKLPTQEEWEMMFKV